MCIMYVAKKVPQDLVGYRITALFVRFDTGGLFVDNAKQSSNLLK